MSNDLDGLMDDLPGGEGRLAELFAQVTASLAAVAERARGLGDLLQAGAGPGAGWGPGSPAWAQPGLQDAPADGLGASRGARHPAAADTSPGRDQDQVAAENVKANQQTAKAVEEILRNGVKLQDLPPAVWGE